MATRENINTGIFANDGTGDGIRQSNIKINNNFKSLFSILGIDENTIMDTGVNLNIESLDFVSNTPDGYLVKVTIPDDAITENLDIKFPLNSGVISLVSNTETLSNKTLESPKINSVLLTQNSYSYTLELEDGITSNRTIKIPKITTSDTLVASKNSQSLSNKTIDSTNILQNVKVNSFLCDANGNKSISIPVNVGDNHVEFIDNTISSVNLADSTDLPLVLKGFGNAGVEVNKIHNTYQLITDLTTAIDQSIGLVAFNVTVNGNYTIPNGVADGEILSIINVNSGIVTLDNSNINISNTIDITNDEPVKLIWISSINKWSKI